MNDLEGNITVQFQIICRINTLSSFALFLISQKVRTRYNAHSAQSATLELLIYNERSEKKQPATDGLMWLLRGLAFTYKALRAAQADAQAELSKAFTSGYEATLKHYHNFVVKGIFSVSFVRCIIAIWNTHSR